MGAFSFHQGSCQTPYLARCARSDPHDDHDFRRKTGRGAYSGCTEPGAFYVLDRGYVDFERLYRFVLTASFFVTRTKVGILRNRLESRPVDRTTGLRSDHIVWLTTPQSVAHYPDRLRRVSYRDPEEGKVLVCLTNNFDLPALAIALLYKLRWRVELFFKWISKTCESNISLATPTTR